MLASFTKSRCIVGGALIALLGGCGSVVVSQSAESDGAVPIDGGLMDVDGGPALSDAGPDVVSDVTLPPPWACVVDSGLPAPGAGCPVIDPNGYGACEVTSWSGFDGKGCVPVTGCLSPSPPYPPGVFGTEIDCAVACGMAGECDMSKMAFGFLPGHPLEGTMCDDIEIVMPFEQSRAEAICAITGQLSCEAAADGAMRCRWSGHAFDHVLSVEDARRLCALSLVPAVETIGCWVYL